MFSNIPPITKALLIANGVAFLLQQLLGDAFFAAFMLWPLGAGSADPFAMSTTFLPWQLLTYGFLHGSFAHVAFNMLALLMFGAPLEYTWGN
jgi:membrane associated rhomboid family serine protease